jgi:hypothetical protein
MILLTLFLITFSLVWNKVVILHYKTIGLLDTIK